MTGVYNREHDWETMLRNEFDNCRRHNRDATLLIIDIDHFKSINDTWGHDVGNEDDCGAYPTVTNYPAR